MTKAERLAHAVLLFHRGNAWTVEKCIQWTALTGETEATPRVLCDLARRLLAETQESAA